MLLVIADESEFSVLYKPANMDFHADQGSAGFFLQAQSQLGCKLFPVHRLDKVTSGLIVLAKSSKAAAELSDLFAKHQVHKLYLAIATKKPKKKQGAIVGDMVRSRRRSWKLAATRSNPAVTQFFSRSLSAGLRLYILQPRTGKTHQLRVAMKSLGAPILGDDLYAGDTADRTYLHSCVLAFLFRGQPFEFFALPLEGAHFHTPVFQNTLAEFGSLSEIQWPSIMGTGD